MCINNNFSKDDILLSLRTDNGIIGFIYSSIVSLYRIINKIYLYKSALLHTIFPRYLYLTTNKNKVELYETRKKSTKCTPKLN